MEAKRLLKMIYEVKEINTELIELMVDYESTQFSLTKKEMEELASRLEEVQHGRLE